MSIRFRLTLLYSAILALTLIALGIAIYATVSQVTFASESNAVSAEARSIAGTLQPHLGPDQPGTHPQGQGGGPQQPQQGTNPPPGQGTLPDSVHIPTINIGSFVPPQHVAAQNAIQICGPGGSILYRSADLVAAHTSLPLSATTRQQLQPGDTAQSVKTVGAQRLLIVTMRLQAGNASSAGTFLQVAQSLQDLDQTLATLRQMLLLGGVVATLVAFGAGWWLAGTALHPITRMTQTAREVGDTQDFSRRVTYSGPADEIGRLAATFNTMLSRLQAAYQTQRRFVADASHELRTPLTSIRGNLSLLERRPAIAEADRDAVVADLVSDSERLSRLVNDLLTLARSDARRALQQEVLAVNPLIADTLRRLAVVHPGRLEHEPGHRGALVIANADALTQVLVIVLDNALKFSGDEGMVTVRVSTLPDTVTIAVRDGGPGIAPAVLPHIFERFYRGDAARAGAGSGLGLAIARSLVESMQGTIAVETEVGHGACFTVSLPNAVRTGT